MKEINVVAAIILDKNKVLITQRGYGEFKDKWEFPGGKIENNESKEEALIREIKEELDADIKIIKHFIDVDYDYPKFKLHMSCYICKLANKHLVLKEHEKAKFCLLVDILKEDFLPADIIVIKKLINL